MRKDYSKPTVRKVQAGSEEGKRLLGQLRGAERRRSTRVVIQVPVQAYFQNSYGIEVRADASTLGVNAHGCLLGMHLKPDEGQRMHLLNVKSAVEQSGTVIRVERSRDDFVAIAFEFDSPAPQLWSIPTPPADWSFFEHPQGL